jgi:glycosyltransferase involved in cell wall biosynthesis
MRVCHIVPSLEDRHGGPSKSVRALANAQAALGDTIDLLATVADSQSVAHWDHEAATIRTFSRLTPRWLSRSPSMRQHLASSSYDCLHNHALWLLPLHYAHQAAVRHGIPLIISPRGMMSGWAHQHRRWRKILAERFIHPGAFADAAGWHATSPGEADDIRRLGFKQPVCISPNGVNLPTADALVAARTFWHQLCPASLSRPVVLYYSRFHRKKRLRELVELWLSAPRGDWLILIVGLAEDYSAQEIDSWISIAGARERIAVFDGANRPPPYAVASLFVLPSHSENFGLVIAEALAAGVPALVTDTTPWQGLAGTGSGWCVSWEKFNQTLGIALSTPSAELAAMGNRGRSWASREFTWEQAARRLKMFYQYLHDEWR